MNGKKNRVCLQGGIKLSSTGKRNSREFVCCYLFRSSKRDMEEGGHFGQFPEKVSRLALFYKQYGSTTCLPAFSIVIVQDGLPTVKSPNVSLV